MDADRGEKTHLGRASKLAVRAQGGKYIDDRDAGHGRDSMERGGGIGENANPDAMSSEVVGDVETVGGKSQSGGRGAIDRFVVVEEPEQSARTGTFDVDAY